MKNQNHISAWLLKKSVKDALDGIKLYGIDLYATLEKLYKIDKLSYANIADSLIVSDGLFVDFQKGLKKIINILPKNKKIIFKDTLTTCTLIVTLLTFMKAASPVAEYITFTSVNRIQFVTNANVTLRKASSTKRSLAAGRRCEF